jgi:hypothetical protein
MVQRCMQALGRERLAAQPKFQAQRLAESRDARSSACIGKDREEQAIREKPLRRLFAPHGRWLVEHAVTACAGEGDIASAYVLWM